MNATSCCCREGATGPHQACEHPGNAGACTPAAPGARPQQSPAAPSAAVSPSLAHAVSQALDVIATAYSQFSEEEMVLSFNGGKDCTVLLHLLSMFCESSGGRYSLRRLRAMYIVPESPFSELHDFVYTCCERYGLQLTEIKGRVRSGVKQFMGRTPAKAFFMGTREIDPDAVGIDHHMAPATAGWPELLRVMPVLRWSYADVWEFLGVYGVPYCSLYDQGYTSLGDARLTSPNPMLQRPDGTFMPARMLQDGAQERLGRRAPDATPPAAVSPAPATH